MLFRLILILGLLLVVSPGCGGQGSGASEGFVERGDLDALTERGVLRAVVPGTALGEPSLPRQGSPVAQQRELAAAFAESLGLELELVPVFRLGEMLPLLEEGRADIIAANLTSTESRRERVDFSLPIDHVREMVLTAAGNTDIHSIEDLEGRTIMVDPATSFWDSLSALREDYSGIHLLPGLDYFNDEATLDLVARGQVDATVRDSNIAEMYLSYRQDLRAAFHLGERQPIAWAVRKGTPELQAALNRFLTTEQLTRPREDRYLADLPELKERRVLRILLPNSPASYFLWRGELAGFEYELARRFAERHRMRLEVVVPPTPALAFEWLEEGRADIAGGFLERNGTGAHAVAYTDRLHQARLWVVGRLDDSPERVGWEDLTGATVAGNAGSMVWQELEDRAREHGFVLLNLVDGTDAEDMLNRMVAGEFDYAVVEEHLLGLELAVRDNIRKHFEADTPVQHAWAVRSTDEALLAALNEFFGEKYRGVIYNVLYRRYFEDERAIRLRQDESIQITGKLSPWDEMVQRHAEKLDFDWRLIVAQMYYESRFDPNAVSSMGALGLMQVTPRAGEQVGVTDLENPADNIRAGMLYLDWVRQRFPEELPVADRMWFSLASYNAGLGHVMDARRLAAQKGWDPDRWFDNVEHAMLLLSQKKYYTQARHGYVRGSEPVSYLDRISSLYKAYVRLTEEQLAGIPGD